MAVSTGLRGNTEKLLQDFDAYAEKYNVRKLLKNCIIELGRHKPEDPAAFLADHFTRISLKQMKGQRVGSAASASDSQQDQFQDQQQEEDATMSAHNKHSDDEDDAEPEPPPPKPAAGGRKRREAFSNETIDPEEAANYVKKVVEKDPKLKAEIEKAVQKNLLFQHLDAREKGDVIDAMFPMEFKAGDAIINQGDDGDNFYVSYQGEVEVFVNNNRICTLPEGSGFGELALIYNKPRAATIKALSEVVKVWALDRDTYTRILMSSTIKKRQMYDEFLKQVPILETLDQWERLTVADALVPCEFNKGDTVIKQGDPGEDFFIIVEGEARVLMNKSAKEQSVQVGRLSKSAYFGELALIFNKPRAATVIADSHLRCVKLDRARFERLLGPCATILQRNLEKYNQYIKPDK